MAGVAMVTATTTRNANLDRYELITTNAAKGGLTVEGTRRLGWHVRLANGIEVAHYVDPSLDAYGALTRYRQQRSDAERSKDG